jgi:hypothetical protein
MIREEVVTIAVALRYETMKSSVLIISTFVICLLIPIRHSSRSSSLVCNRNHQAQKHSKLRKSMTSIKKTGAD